MRTIRTDATRAAALPCALALVGLTFEAGAVEYAASVGYTGEYTSNAGRQASETSEESDIVHRPRADFTAFHEDSRFSVGMDYHAQRRIYQDDTFDNETVLEGAGQVSWNVIPRRLVVFGSHERAETEIRSSGQAVPDNLQESAESVAGASLTLDSIGAQQIILGYEYSDVSFEDTGNDSTRHNATVTYSIPLSETDVFSIVGTGSKVDFDDELAPDYESATGSLAYHREASRLTTDVTVGYQSIDREMGRDTVEGVVGEIAFLRELSATSTLGLSYGQDLRDNSLEFGTARIDLDNQEVLDGSDFIGDTDLNEVYEEKRVALTYDTQIGVNTFGAGVDATRQDFEDVDRNVESISFGLQLGRAIRSDLDGRISADYRYYKYDDIESEDDEYQFEIGLLWRRSLRLDIGLELSYFQRSRQDMETADSKIKDWGASISVDYRLFGTPRR